MGSGLVVSAGGILTVLNYSNVDTVTIYLQDAPSEGFVVIASTPNRPAEGTIAGVVLNDIADECRTSLVSQTAQTISITITQVPCDTGLSRGQITGIIVGVIVAGLLIGIILLIIMVRRRRKRALKTAQALRANEQENAAALANQVRRPSWFERNYGNKDNRKASAEAKAARKQSIPLKTTDD